MASDSLTRPDRPRGEQATSEIARVGEWYWANQEDGPRWLGCVVHVGTNYVELSGPIDERSYNSQRFSLDDFERLCAREPDAGAVIAARVAEERQIIASAVRQLEEMSSRLCLASSRGVPEAQALVRHDGSSMDGYRRDLEAARKEGIPELEETIRRASARMRTWMQAEAIPLAAEEAVVKKTLEAVESRIAGVEIYAGLAESLVKIRDGSPAEASEPLHLHQRRLYMDEECLASYEAGGMTFEDIGAFDAWLCRDANFSRVLPHPRCAVALRVRRLEHEPDAVDVLGDFVQMLFGGDKKDMRTYLYLRNGEQAWRLETQIDFGDKLYPDAERSILRRGELYGVMFAGKVDRIATAGEHQEMLAKGGDNFYSWEPWDPSSLYCDDVTESVQEMLTARNRVVLLLQGIYDRSPALRPHPTYRLWLEEDYARAIRLVFDSDRALVPGAEPDFAAYQREANRCLRVGSLAVGADEAWARREAERYNEKMRINASRGGWAASYEYRRYRPHDNPGPGVIARVQGRRRGSCTFGWERPAARQSDHHLVRNVRETIAVPETELLAVEGYRPGDFRKFYDDPRTRAKYLQWAPLLLRAEEWHAGRRDFGHLHNKTWHRYER